MTELKFTVPLVPPSVNMYVRHTRTGKHYVTKEAKAFKYAVAIFAKGRRIASEPFEVAISVFLGKGRRGDADNFQKVVLDGLVECGAIRSDAAARKVSVEKFRDWANPRTEITVRAI